MLDEISVIIKQQFLPTPISNQTTRNYFHIKTPFFRWQQLIAEFRSRHKRALHYLSITSKKKKFFPNKTAMMNDARTDPKTMVIFTRNVNRLSKNNHYDFLVLLRYR